MIAAAQGVKCNPKGGSSATFDFHGDGKRVKRIEKGLATTVFIGAIFELNLSTIVTTTYDSAGGKPLAERRGGVLYFLQGDHPGSVSLMTAASGTPVFQARYSAFGGTRAAAVGTPEADVARQPRHAPPPDVVLRRTAPPRRGRRRQHGYPARLGTRLRPPGV